MRQRFLAGTVVVWSGLGAARSAVGALGADYWDPVSALDYASIWTYSASLGLAAVIAWVVASMARAGMPAAAAGRISAAGFAVAGVANGLEDGLEMSALSIAYVLGIVVGAFGTLVFAFALRAAGSRMLAAVAALLFVPFLFLESWIGLGVVVPALWAAWRLWASPVAAPAAAASLAQDATTPT